MPTVLRERGFRFVINTDDHPPPHVHVKRGGSEAVIEFEGVVEVRDNWGLRREDLRIAFQIVKRNQEALLTAWRRIYDRLR